MNQADKVSMDEIAEVLGSIRRKGVRLWSENGQLHFRAPRGALTPEEIARLKGSRDEITALLERAARAESGAAPLTHHPHLNRAPLAFSQLARWQLYQSGERRPMRQLASVMRLQGRLNFEVLRKSVGEVVARHDALRTRIAVFDGIPAQEIEESTDYDVTLHDLRTLSPGAREAEVRRLTEHLIVGPIDLAVDPLFELRMLRLSDDEHVMIVAMEHIIADGVSLNILLRDLFTLYIHMHQGQVCSLPAIPVQFSDYALWQRTAQRSWLDTHGAYWGERLAKWHRLKFPDDKAVSNTTTLDWATVPIRIDAQLKAQLQEWCRLRQTTFVMTVFAAYAALVLRWCNVSQAVFRYVSSGRDSHKTENTIGYFASMLYVPIELRGDDRFSDLVRRVTQDYCRAYEHADFSYLATQVPEPEFTRNAGFNWLPVGSPIDFSPLQGTSAALTSRPIQFEHPILKSLELDIEPAVLLIDSADEISGDLYFPLNRFTIGTMERFGRNFLASLNSLPRNPEEPILSTPLLP